MTPWKHSKLSGTMHVWLFYSTVSIKCAKYHPIKLFILHLSFQTESLQSDEDEGMQCIDAETITCASMRACQVHTSVKRRNTPLYKSIGGGLQCSAHEAAVLFGKLAARGRGALLSRLWNYEQRWSDQHLVLNIIPTDLRPWSSEPAFSSHSSFPR